MELYYAAGNNLVQELRTRGFQVFLDLKLHDIPNTVAGAVRSATHAGASLLTVHASGGGAMLAAAAEAASAPEAPKRTGGRRGHSIAGGTGPSPRKASQSRRHRRHGLLRRRGRHPANRHGPTDDAGRSRDPPRRSRHGGPKAHRHPRKSDRAGSIHAGSRQTDHQGDRPRRSSSSDSGRDRPSLSRPFAPGPKKIVRRGVLFFGVEKRPSTYQLYHAFHHNFTTKAPRSAHRFSQKPLQKRPCTTDKKVCTAGA